MKIRDGEHAVVDLAKLQLYCLDQSHPRGGRKAKQFEARLGIASQNAEELQQQLLEAVKTSEEAVTGVRDAHGLRYQLDVEVTGPKGTAKVRTYWLSRTGSPAPRFLTCHVV